MNTILKTGVVSAIAVVLVASAVVVSGQQLQRRGHGMGGPGGRWMAPAIMRELTDEQRTQVRAILEEQRSGQQGPPAGMKLQRELQAELLADVPNDQRIEELKGQILSAQAEGLSRHIAVQKRIAEVLTPEQRAKARERLAQTPDRRRGEGRGRGGQRF